MPTRPFDARKLPDAASMRQIPSLTEAVEGWRSWRVRRVLPPFGNPPKLESVTHGKHVDDGYWTPRRVAEAVCPRYVGREDLMPDNHVGSRGCKCGFYSAKSLEHLRDIGYLTYGEDREYVSVVGRVACWGTVTEGSLGWRSQYCYPKHLFVPAEATNLIKPLREAYGVPTVLNIVLDVDLTEPFRAHPTVGGN